MKKTISHLILLSICLSSIIVQLHIIDRNVNDPDLIAYFNHDEAFLMDLAWLYYSGEKRESFQYESDYGIELLYLSTFSKYILSHFFEITPGTLVYILRWLHLLFWVLSLIVAYQLIARHFGYSFIYMLPLLLLATNPSFPYLSRNLKPEPIVLFFMILGLDYALKMIDEPNNKNLIISIICSAAAAAIKYAGFFLLPIITIACFLSKKNNSQSEKKHFEIKSAWLFPAIIGIFLILWPLILICLYQRQTNGLTWLQEFGLWNSIKRNYLISCLIFMGSVSTTFSAFIYFLKRINSPNLTLLVSHINSFLSLLILNCGLFLFFLSILLIGWLLQPSYLIQATATLGQEALLTFNETTFFYSSVNFLKYFFIKIHKFGALLLILWSIYLMIEIRLMKRRPLSIPANTLKRYVLCSFVIIGLILIAFPIRFEPHHQMPFLFTASILVIQGLHLLPTVKFKNTWHLTGTKFLILCLIFTSLFRNTLISVNAFKDLYHWKEDVIFDIIQWFEHHIPYDISILTDHPTRVYLPAQYKNKKVIKYQKDRTAQIRQLVTSYKPKMLYLNITKDTPSVASSLESLPIQLKLIKVFTNHDKPFKRFAHSQFVIYEVSYY